MIYEFEDIVQLHVEKFGVEPVFTGENFANSEKIVDLIIDAINSDKPYVENDLPDGVLT